MKKIQSITAIAAIFIMGLVSCSSSINKGKNKPGEVQQVQPPVQTIGTNIDIQA